MRLKHLPKREEPKKDADWSLRISFLLFGLMIIFRLIYPEKEIFIQLAALNLFFILCKISYKYKKN